METEEKKMEEETKMSVTEIELAPFLPVIQVFICPSAQKKPN